MDETNLNGQCLLKYTILYSSIKSLIMKKSILTLSIAILAMGSNLMANEITQTTRVLNNELITNVDVSTLCKAVIQGDTLQVSYLKIFD